MPPSLQRWLPITLLGLSALVLRVADLGARPMHADEANQALKTGQLLEDGSYVFDPVDHHGPTLYYATLAVAWLRGETTVATLSESTVRLVPALAGTGAVLLLYLFALPLGRWPALTAAALLAVSPPAVYYSRYFIQESLLVTFTLGTLLCTANWWRQGNCGWIVGAGICAGLMQATKASAPFLLLATFVGLLAARPNRPVSTRLKRDIGVGLLVALVVAGSLYSSFGQNPRGLFDAVGTYGTAPGRLAGGGHAKPWWYYFTLFGWHREGGVLTHQMAFSIVALLGAMQAFSRSGTGLLRGVAGYVAILAVTLSCLPYKTPWHAIHLVPGLALLASGALAAYSVRFRSRIVPVGLVTLILLSQAQQVRLTSFLRPADERNPYAYVHTAPDILKLRPLVMAAPAGVVRIISEEVWPLPWYLRDLRQVGYWTTVPPDCDGALVIASAGLAEQVRSRLHGSYETGFVGLRPGFTLVVFKRSP